MFKQVDPKSSELIRLPEFYTNMKVESSGFTKEQMWHLGVYHLMRSSLLFMRLLNQNLISITKNTMFYLQWQLVRHLHLVMTFSKLHVML